MGFVADKAKQFANWVGQNATDIGLGAATGGMYNVNKALAGGYGIPGVGGKNAPAAPDFQNQAAADANAAQANINAQTAANRPDQTTPFGYSNWTQNPDGSWTQNAGFGGQLGAASGLLQGQMMDAFGKPMLTGNQARDQAIQAAYGQATSRLDPQWAQREAGLRTQLINQGLDPTSEAFKTEMQNFNLGRNDAYSSAMNSAIGQGTQAGAALFDQNMAARNMPLQNLLAMQGFLNMPGFQGAGAARGPDSLGAAQLQYGAEQDAFNQKNQWWRDLISGGVNATKSFVKGG